MRKLKLFSFAGILCFTLSSGVAYALNTVATGFLAGAEITVNAHGTCKKVKKTSGLNVFVPTKTAGEWSAFIAHKPSNIVLSACPVSVNPNVSCLAWGYCRTANVNICSLIPSLQNGESFSVTTDISGSSWIHGSYNPKIRTVVFQKGQSKTDYRYSNGTYRSQARKRNYNWRIYDGGCIFYAQSQYGGSSTNGRWAAIAITNINNN